MRMTILNIKEKNTRFGFGARARRSGFRLGQFAANQLGERQGTQAELAQPNHGIPAMQHGYPHFQIELLARDG